MNIVYCIAMNDSGREIVYLDQKEPAARPNWNTLPNELKLYILQLAGYKGEQNRLNLQIADGTLFDERTTNSTVITSRDDFQRTTSRNVDITSVRIGDGIEKDWSPVCLGLSSTILAPPRHYTNLSSITFYKIRFRKETWDALVQALVFAWQQWSDYKSILKHNRGARPPCCLITSLKFTQCNLNAHSDIAEEKTVLGFDKLAGASSPLCEIGFFDCYTRNRTDMAEILQEAQLKTLETFELKEWRKPPPSNTGEHLVKTFEGRHTLKKITISSRSLGRMYGEKPVYLSVLESIAKNCPALETLTLDPCLKWTDHLTEENSLAIARAISRMKSLRILHISGLGDLPKEGFELLGTHPSLTTLSLHQMNMDSSRVRNMDPLFQSKTLLRLLMFRPWNKPAPKPFEAEFPISPECSLREVSVYFSGKTDTPEDEADKTPTAAYSLVKPLAYGLPKLQVLCLDECYLHASEVDDLLVVGHDSSRPWDTLEVQEPTFSGRMDDYQQVEELQRRNDALQEENPGKPFSFVIVKES